jgi:hypothetical protein
MDNGASIGLPLYAMPPTSAAPSPHPHPGPSRIVMAQQGPGAPPPGMWSLRWFLLIHTEFNRAPCYSGYRMTCRQGKREGISFGFEYKTRRTATRSLVI